MPPRKTADPEAARALRRQALIDAWTGRLEQGAPGVARAVKAGEAGDAESLEALAALVGPTPKGARASSSTWAATSKTGWFWPTA